MAVAISVDELTWTSGNTNNAVAAVQYHPSDSEIDAFRSLCRLCWQLFLTTLTGGCHALVPQQPLSQRKQDSKECCCNLTRGVSQEGVARSVPHHRQSLGKWGTLKYHFQPFVSVTFWVHLEFDSPLTLQGPYVDRIVTSRLANEKNQ